MIKISNWIGGYLPVKIKLITYRVQWQCKAYLIEWTRIVVLYEMSAEQDMMHLGNANYSMEQTNFSTLAWTICN